MIQTLKYLLAVRQRLNHAYLALGSGCESKASFWPCVSGRGLTQPRFRHAQVGVVKLQRSAPRNRRQQQCLQNGLHQHPVKFTGCYQITLILLEVSCNTGCIVSNSTQETGYQPNNASNIEVCTVSGKMTFREICWQKFPEISELSQPYLGRKLT